MEKLEKKLDELSDMIGAIQEKNDKNEKRFDSMLSNEIKGLEEKADGVLSSIEEIKKEREEEQKRIEFLEKLLSKKGNAGEEQEDHFKKYQTELMGYLRTGKKMDREIAKKGLMDFFSMKGISKEELEQKTMQVGIDPQGGYWVMPERLAMMIGRDFETSPVRRVANVITTQSDSVEMIIDDNESTAGGWTTETATRSTSAEPDIGLLTIYTHEQYTEHKVTQKLLDDAGFDVAGWLLDKINMKLSRDENTAFVLGNGAGKPKGFLSYSAWAVKGTYERNKIEQIASGAAAAITADGLIDLQNSLHEIYQPNAAFMMRRQTWGKTLKLKEATTGAYLIDRQLIRNGQGQMVLLGQPVIFASDMPAVSAGNLPIAYGDFRLGYTIVDKVGVITIRDNITDKGRVKFYLSRRTGGAVTNFDSIKIQKIAAS